MLQRVFLAICILGSCLGIAGQASSVTLAYTANRQGETGPCGCQIRDIGGLDRMAVRLKQLKSEGATLFVDAGNSFFSAPKIKEDRRKTELTRAERIAKSYQEMGLKGFSPGERDFAGGVSFFWGLVRKSGVSVVSANLESTTANAAFKPYEIYSLQGIRIALTGLTLFSDKLLPVGIKQRDPQQSFREVWKQLQAEKPDRVVLLSQLDKNDNEALANEFPGIWIIGSKSMDFFQDPKKIGKGFLFEVGIGGQRLGEIKLQKDQATWTQAQLTELGEEFDKLKPNKK